MNTQRSITILFLGDVIGKPGRAVIKRYLNEVKPSADLVVANAENAAHGFGITQSNLAELREAGVLAFTGGNHTFDRKETLEFIDGEVNLLRPANYPEGTPGKGYCVMETAGVKIAILNLMGRVFMEPLRSPFTVADELLPHLKEQTNVILVDMHAEATAEKIALGWYLDGRVSAVIGSHTHVQTADERVLPAGTAYITDVGCCGPFNGVIGMEREAVFRRMVKQLPTRLEVAQGPAMVNGVLIEIETATGRARGIKRVQFHEDTYSHGA
jgi:metallophosphoesterase (TIGR00282 family)